MANWASSTALFGCEEVEVRALRAWCNTERVGERSACMRDEGTVILSYYIVLGGDVGVVRTFTLCLS